MLQFNSKNRKQFYLSKSSKAIVCAALARATASPCILRVMIPRLNVCVDGLLSVERAELQ